MADITKPFIIIGLCILLVDVVAAATFTPANWYEKGTATWPITELTGMKGTKFRSNATGELTVVSLEVTELYGGGCWCTARIYTHDFIDDKPGYVLGSMTTKKVISDGWNNFSVKSGVSVDKGTDYWLVFNVSGENCFSLKTGTDVRGARAMSFDGEYWTMIRGSNINYVTWVGAVTQNDVIMLTNNTKNNVSDVCISEGGVSMLIRGGKFCFVNNTYLPVESLVNGDVNSSKAQNYNMGSLIYKDNPTAGWAILVIVMIFIVLFIKDRGTISKERKITRVSREENRRVSNDYGNKDKRRLRPDGGYY